MKKKDKVQEKLMDNNTKGIKELEEKFPYFVDNLKQYICKEELSEKAKCILCKAQVRLSVTETNKAEAVPLNIDKAKRCFWISSTPNEKGDADEQQIGLKNSGTNIPKNCLYIEEKKEEVAYSGDTLLTGRYSLIARVSINDFSDIFTKIVMKVLALCLLRLITDLGDVKDITEEQWNKFCNRYNYNFMNWYIKALEEVCTIPDLNIIRKISYESYEQRSVNAIMYLTEEGKVVHPEEEGIIFWPVNYTIENLYIVRKMLETCKIGERGLLVSQEKYSRILGLATKDYLDKYFKDGRKTYIAFLGKGEWKLVYEEETLLFYHAGEFFLEREHVDKVLETEFRSKCGGNYEIFKPILERLRANQEHGALMIIGDDAKGEAERLCAKARGIMPEPIDLKKKENEALIDGIAGIDGAMLVDPEGFCYGYGVILDGEVVVEGDVGRGSRYNSSYNYVHIDKTQKRCAVIISEDKEKGIEIHSWNETKGDKEG